MTILRFIFNISYITLFIFIRFNERIYLLAIKQKFKTMKTLQRCWFIKISFNFFRTATLNFNKNCLVYPGISNLKLFK